MSLDNDLKKTFERHALEQDATPQAWAGIEQKVRRSHRRQAITTGVLALMLIVAAASTVPMLRTDPATPDEGQFATDDPTPDPTTDVGPGTPPPPVQYVALVNGAIELYSTKTGERVRTLAARKEGVLRRNLTLSGGTAHFVEEPMNDETGGCNLRIRAVTSAGEVRTVAGGSAVAISPDRRSMAYVALGAEPRCREGGIVVRDLATGEEREWAWQEWDGAYVPERTSVHSLAWHPDSRHLLFGITVGDPGSELFLLDTTEGDGILDARRLNLTGEPRSGADWSHASFTEDGHHVVVLDRIHHDGERPRELWKVDIRTSTKVDRLIRTELQIEDFATAPGGHVLMTAISFGEKGPQSALRVYLWDGEGEPRLISMGAIEIDW